MSTPSTVTVRIWDLPTRVFHWALAICVFLLLITGTMGGNAMTWHFRLGYAVMTLLLFRMVWGIVGGHWSQWRRLPLSPSLIRAYLKGRSDLAHVAGHNPMGSWSVLAMLFILILQVSSGLVSDDEIANAGPLSSRVSGAWVSLATQWHKSPGKWIIVALVALHLLAILWYRWRKGQSLMGPMWHGDKQLPRGLSQSVDNWSTRLGAIVILGLCATGVGYVIGLGS
ncbi:cytochrome b/b6 domain-containing protein [Limnohabitans lacus]|jgi:cytochrome b|uniref:Cytochrome b/b6 domain-containing protein n=1 Tax=Limnohabitans lacus TaxID=3045173 RepID=A0ABT6X922_9BURK|nr:cytochrome b/b6 domain-containing protein [Limnohabitans sp. HM2-2]MDI9234498.1 cytochrome b/b6 domain-containing protein [Limnohabitans sp. HM2-2]